MAAGPDRMDRCNPIGLTATGTSLSAVARWCWWPGAGRRIRGRHRHLRRCQPPRRRSPTALHPPAGAGKCHAGHGDSGSRRPLRHPAARVDAPVDGQRAGPPLRRRSGTRRARGRPHPRIGTTRAVHLGRRVEWMADEDRVRAAVDEAPTLSTYVSAPGEGHAQQLLYDVDDGPSKVRSQVMGFVKSLRP